MSMFHVCSISFYDHAMLFVEDVHAIWQPDEFKAASGVVVKSDGDDRSIPRLDEAIDSS